MFCLLVDSVYVVCTQGGFLSLCEVRVLGQPGSDALLEMAGHATLLFVVRDEASFGGQRQDGRGVTIRVQHPGSAAYQACEAAASSRSAEHMEAGEQRSVHAGGADEPGAASAMDPDTERGVCMHIVEACRAFLAGALTSATQDARLLAELGDACHESLHRSNMEWELGSAAKPPSVHDRWQRLCHQRMALQYRLQRKLLLSRVADDLAAQACMLSA